MHKRPEPTDLLRIASEALTEEILPHVPHDKRYMTAMIVNAIAIAARQMAAKDDDHTGRLLNTVYGEYSDTSWDQLADDLRSGAISEESHPNLLDHLITSVRAELAVSNPRFKE